MGADDALRAKRIKQRHQRRDFFINGPSGKGTGPVPLWGVHMIYLLMVTAVSVMPNMRLVVESSGVITGDIAYGDLEIRRGGELLGNINQISQTKPQSKLIK